MKDVRDTGVQRYAEAVRDGTFPDAEAESYAMDETEWDRFLQSEGVHVQRENGGDRA